MNYMYLFHYNEKLSTLLTPPYSPYMYTVEYNKL
jgi:hypothetical protein